VTLKFNKLVLRPRALISSKESLKLLHNFFEKFYITVMYHVFMLTDK